jgi:hypothetical protein
MNESTDKVVRRLCKMAGDDFHFGELASLEAISTLGAYLDSEMAVAHLLKIASSDFHFGEEAQMAALKSLTKRRA